MATFISGSGVNWNTIECCRTRQRQTVVVVLLHVVNVITPYIYSNFFNMVDYYSILLSYPYCIIGTNIGMNKRQRFEYSWFVKTHQSSPTGLSSPFYQMRQMTHILRQFNSSIICGGEGNGVRSIRRQKCRERDCVALVLHLYYTTTAKVYNK